MPFGFFTGFASRHPKTAGLLGDLGLAVEFYIDLDMLIVYLPTVISMSAWTAGWVLWAIRWAQVYLKVVAFLRVALYLFGEMGEDLKDILDEHCKKKE